jgi:cytochrome c
MRRVGRAQRLGAALLAGVGVCLGGLLTQRAQAAPPEAATPHLGQPVTPAQAARWDRNVFPDGQGLPPGQGTAAQGKVLFDALCAGCHGPGGRGASAVELAGGTEPLTAASPDKTIGLYWPYATTLFDFTRRAMPMNAPGSLTDDQVYALTAYLLAENHVIPDSEPMNAATLPRVQMPNHNGFVWIDGKPR